MVKRLRRSAGVITFVLFAYAALAYMSGAVEHQARSAAWGGKVAIQQGQSDVDVERIWRVHVKRTEETTVTANWWDGTVVVCQLSNDQCTVRSSIPLRAAKSVKRTISP